MTRLVVLTEYYLPAVRAGGPPNSVAALVESADLDVRIVCRDRDLGEAKPFGLPYVDDVRLGGVGVRYVDMTRPRDRIRALLSLRDLRPDVLYLNSFHNIWFSIIPVMLARLGLYGRAAVLISPRGELGEWAMTRGRTRLKRLNVSAWRVLGLHRFVTWLATSEHEACDIRRRWRGRCEVEVVMATSPVRPVPTSTPGSEQSPRRLTYLGRIVPQKGLLQGVRAAARCRFPVVIDVYGPVEDPSYWRQVEQATERLPGHVRLSYRGVAARDEVPQILARSDALLAPTYGENFGHSVFEALANACPVIVGRNTPWTAPVRAGAGWVVDPDDQGTVTAAVDAVTSASEEQLHRLRAGALGAARSWVRDAARHSLEAACSRAVTRAHGRRRGEASRAVR